MTNVCVKIEKIGPNQTLVIDQTRLYTPDGRTDEQTVNCCKPTYPLFFERGHENTGIRQDLNLKCPHKSAIP